MSGLDRVLCRNDYIITSSDFYSTAFIRLLFHGLVTLDRDIWQHLRERLSIHGGDYSDPSSHTTIRMVTPVRASIRVCQNLLGKFYVLPTSKKLCKVKKRVYLQQFDIIHLPNSDLTYIRNPERNKIMFVHFHLLKNLHQESLFILYFFFTLPPRGKHRL
jgi:hypothetical protein